MLPGYSAFDQLSVLFDMSEGRVMGREPYYERVDRMNRSIHTENLFKFQQPTNEVAPSGLLAV